MKPDSHSETEDTAMVSPVAGETPELTEERAQVAALVAGALLANALPRPIETPAPPDNAHGSAASAWVSTNRARALLPWQPRRRRGG